MAGEVLRGETLGARSGEWISLAFVPVTLALAAAPYPLINFEPNETGGFGYEADTWFARAFFVVMALLAAKAAAGLRRPMSGALLEIDRDAIHSTTSSGKERTIARAAVRSTSCSVNYLWFESALGDRIQEIPIIMFDVRDVRAALNRQGWNIKGYVDPRR